MAVLRDLGFPDVKVYKPGWLGYAPRLSAPAEDEAFINIGAMKRQIGSLQARIDKLEKEMAGRKEARRQENKQPAITAGPAMRRQTTNNNRGLQLAFDSGYEAGAEDAGSGELLVEDPGSAVRPV